MARILVSDKLDKQGLEILQASGGLEVDVKPGLPPDELKAIIGSYEGLVIRSGTKVTADLLSAATNLRIIGRAGIGVDNVDVEAASKRGIIVSNTPGGNNVTTGEHAISMMLACAREIPQANATLRAGQWKRNDFVGVEITGKTLGVIGLGNIGAIVADRARGLRMNVLGYDPFVNEEAAARLGIELASLDEIWARADFLTVHVPLLPDTKGLIGAARFFSILGQEVDANPTIDYFIPSGDDVVAVGRLRGKTRKTGTPIDVPIVHIWTVGAGKITRFAAYIDTPAMLHALGLVS